MNEAKIPHGQEAIDKILELLPDTPDKKCRALAIAKVLNLWSPEPEDFKPNATITVGDSCPVHGIVGGTNQEDRT